MPQHVRRLALGVTGSIAAYKAADLIEAFRQARYDVTVLMTEEAKTFIGPLTLQALSGRPVCTSMFHDASPTGQGLVHTELAAWADILLIAPATAQIIAKLAHGLADDIISCVALATRAPIVIAPAMNVHMYEHPATQRNLEQVQALRYRIIEPTWGHLACGYEGTGHIAEVETIVRVVRQVPSRAPTCSPSMIPSTWPARRAGRTQSA